MATIIGRNRELKLLDKIYQSGKPEFLAIYGRRRVGKTYLIREFFKNKGLYFTLIGVKGASSRKQLTLFTKEFLRVFGPMKNYTAPRNWLEAFDQLKDRVEKVKQNERIILFLDELPWLATPRSGFLEDLGYFWNNYISTNNRVILIVCGSSASWIIKKIIHNKGGFHGRLTAKIRLLPFDLKETEEYLHAHGVVLDRKSIIDIYMALGGIPTYLNYVQKGESALKTVGNLCFGGPLTHEFDELYAALFDGYARHVNIVKTLASHPYGLTQKQIALETGLTKGGTMTDVLNELEQSGFILSIKDFGKQKKERRYRLVDEYSIFYLKWWPRVEESSLNGSDTLFWTNVFNSSLGRSWAGYAFESICLTHIHSIKKSLGISGVLSSCSSWEYRPSEGSERGTQIDLVIDRADNCINLCEIKYCDKEFIITKACDKDLREKRSIFFEQTKTKKSVFITLISPYGVNKNAGYFGTADVILTMDALFN